MPARSDSSATVAGPPSRRASYRCSRRPSQTLASSADPIMLLSSRSASASRRPASSAAAGSMVVVMAPPFRWFRVADTYRMPPTDHHTDDPSAQPRPLPVQRELFDIPDDVAYFNCASLAPQLRASAEAGVAALGGRARPWTISSGDWVPGAEERRALFSPLARGDPPGV